MKIRVYGLFLALLLLASAIQADVIMAPDFTLKGGAQTVELSAYRGKVVYLDFWASWCIPCRKSFPWMNQIQSKYADQGLVVIAINLDEEPNAAADFLKQVPANFTIAYDPSGQTPTDYGLIVMPSSYLIDRQGNLISKHLGFKAAKAVKVENEIQTLLKQ